MEKRSPGPELKTNILLVANVYFWVWVLIWRVWGEICSAALELGTCLVLRCDPFPTLIRTSGWAVCAPHLETCMNTSMLYTESCPLGLTVGLTLACLWSPGPDIDWGGSGHLAWGHLAAQVSALVLGPLVGAPSGEWCHLIREAGDSL